MRSTHSQRLERWLGAETVEIMSQRMRGWYGTPLPVGNVPGLVYVGGDGDFVGPLKGGYFGSLKDYAIDSVKAKARRFAIRQRATAHSGFSSLGDLISEATTGGKRQSTWFEKGTTTAAATNQTLWPLATYPAAGAAGSNRPGGSVPTNSTAGAMFQTNAGAGDTLHIVTAYAGLAGASTNAVLLLYDRLFHAANILHTTTGNQSISGTSNRYTGTSAVNNFITLEVTSSLGSTAHNATITYTDDAGTSGAGSAQAVTASSVANRLPLPSWFYRLNAAASRGVDLVTNIAFSAVSSGVSQLVQGRPLVVMPLPTGIGSGQLNAYDGINSSFNLVQVQDNACLTFFVFQASASALSYRGEIVMVSG